MDRHQPTLYIRQVRFKQAESLRAIAEGVALGFKVSLIPPLIIGRKATNNERGELLQFS